MKPFVQFFREMTGLPGCHDWQHELSNLDAYKNLLIRIPTGFGKTLGVLSVWLWKRTCVQDERWPRRLVWCLPMRVLVEQTANEVRTALHKLDILWEDGDHEGKVGVHVLMGGSNSGSWHLYPEHDAVLIGTQDMLLSRAMNRGYGAPRARWPMEFGLLNQDALWVMDEVQLMDVGLATSAQIQAFREDEKVGGRSMRPCGTWWMSATLQRNWLEKSPDTTSLSEQTPQLSIAPVNRVGRLWDDVGKPCKRVNVSSSKEIAHLAAVEHIALDRSQSGPTLVVLNTVKTAVEVFKALRADKSLQNTDIRLVHSRFRPHERSTWQDEFLNKNACAPGTDRIIVATQVVEAGVDISASLLITELAPWAGMVQRFGRSARWGGTAQVIILDLAAGLAREAIDKGKKAHEKSNKKSLDEAAITDAAESKAVLPYALDEIRAAREALEFLNDVSPSQLEAFEEAHPELLPRLYPFDPKHLLLRHELDELFDTSPDLSGADIDISRFIRSGDERDLQVFWEDIAPGENPSEDILATREALCAVPFLVAREWLCGKGSQLLKGMRAWVWDWLEGVWRKAESRDFFPGRTFLVARNCGGYDTSTGWDGKSTLPVEPIRRSEFSEASSMEKADAAQDDESMSQSHWQTIAFHGLEVRQRLKAMESLFSPALDTPLYLAALTHDVGKALQTFQRGIVSEDRPARSDLAKAPKHAWVKEKRPRGFRHELAGALALFGVLQRHKPDHPALLGPWRDLLAAAGMPPLESPVTKAPPSEMEQEIIALSADQFNLMLYLVCSHHGKVRVAWHASRFDQERPDGTLCIQGVRNGDVLPALPLYTSHDHIAMFPETILDLAPASAGLNPLTGQGWTERVIALLAHHGPFTLAWIEAILRAADQRASMTLDKDPLLNKEDA